MERRLTQQNQQQPKIIPRTQNFYGSARMSSTQEVKQQMNTFIYMYV